MVGWSIGSVCASKLERWLRARGDWLARVLRWGESRRLFALSIVIGLAGGLAGAALIALLNLAHDIFFGAVSTDISSLWVIGVPALGGLLVGPLVTLVAPETRGHGVPEVMLAVAHQGGRIRARVAAVKAVSSAITIGSGGSAGREGPIVQIGAAVGSALGQVFKEPPEILRMLVACGSAAGIAASFNAPIAGVVFALEVILRDFTGRAFAMVVTSSVASSILARSLVGKAAFFHAPAYELQNGWEIIFYCVLGVIAALVARLFIRFLYASEDAFEKQRLPAWVKPAVGGLLVGVVGYFLPQVFGTGHDGVESALDGSLAFPFLVVLLFGKLVATSMTLGSGGSGGVFAPSLFMGAMLGGAYGKVAEWLFPGTVGGSGGYALVGMGAVFAGASFAPFTAILIIFEMTNDYAIILPLMASCAVSVLVSRAISSDSIYTLKLRRRGIALESPAPRATGLDTIRVEDAMTRQVETIPHTLAGAELLARIRASAHTGFPVVDDGDRLVGLLTYPELRETMANAGDLRAVIAADLMRPKPPTALVSESLAVAAERMRHHGVDRLPVVNETKDSLIIGIVTAHDIVNSISGGAVASGEKPFPAAPDPSIVK
jgi:chloride channel protein, CIC family